ncbi:restriction endonuclease [Clostridium saccharoperbutylacetonicum]|uniref:nSTAND3 domain-containing NTPase n=1 Tax=Clostridium saccharoperbutylacetonicum TaxID=36745 RepID=UPI0039ED1706
MFNYRNLDDVEFEELCKDIMQRKLNTQLRAFRKGVDGGIDLKDIYSGNNIIVQVKHYINSKFSDLRNSLKKEIKKVQSLNPVKYYVCCAQELGPSDTKEIYELFKDYMDSYKNIMTLKEIDDFLKEETNKDIVRKHFKLWLYSSNILSEINNQDIFIDCETLLSDIKEENKYYIQTKTYDMSIKFLEDSGCLILVGSPGVGKTTISKMIVLYYAGLGYRIRYTTNGDISDIKRALSIDKDEKEIILLDDCLGQYYFNMNYTQESELISIIKHVKNNKNKKIILNSRVTILNEAIERSSEFENFITNRKINSYIMDMDKMGTIERARILYNHLYFNNVPDEYYSSIRKNENYFEIIHHRNYSPRIIEYVTQHERYKDIEAETYFGFIISCLDNPKEIWRNEYEKRICKIDRVFILTLFSITDTSVSEDALEECFNKRISNSNIDTTLNNFRDTLNRLNKSMVKIIDNNGKREISVLNPSVNDYLKVVFFDNKVELENIRKSIIFYDQLERCYSNGRMNEVIKEKIINNKFLGLKIDKTNHCQYIQTLLLYYIDMFHILSSEYKSSIKTYIENLDNEKIEKKKLIDRGKIVQSFLQEPLCSYYNIDKFIIDKDFIKKIYSYLELKDLIGVINIIYRKLKKIDNKKFLNEFNNISINYANQLIEEYLEQVDIDEFTYDLDLNYYLDQSKGIVENLDIGDINERYSVVIDIMISMLYKEFKGEIRNKFDELLNNLEVKAVKDDIKLYITGITFDGYGWEDDIISYVKSYLEPDYDDFGSHEEDDIIANDVPTYGEDVIRDIFERNI